MANPEYFPRYLVVRAPVEGGQEQEEWQGFVKDIKNSLHDTTHQIKQNLASTQKKMRSALVESEKRTLKHQDEKLFSIKQEITSKLASQ